MRKPLFALLAVTATLVAGSAYAQMVGHLQDEYIDGLYRVCVYNNPYDGGRFSIMIPHTKLCPLTYPAPNPYGN